MATPTLPYLCYACPNTAGLPGRGFESAVGPKCPNCGADPRADPRHRYLVVRAEVVHFDAPSGVRHVGVGHLACDPSRKMPGGDDTRATGEPALVTCKGCRATAAWKRLMAERGEPELAPDDAIPDRPPVPTPTE